MSFFIKKKLEKSRCEEVVSDTMGLLPATEGQQIIVVGQRKSGGGGGCAQCDQKGGISMTGGALVNENYVDEQ